MNNDNKAPSDRINFRYVLGEKDEVTVVLLYGKISGNEASQLEKLGEELKVKKPPIILMNFRDLSELAPSGYTVFTQLQKTLRNAKKLLGLCGLKPDVKMSLSSAGIIRLSEVYNNVPDAWGTISARIKRVG